MKWSELGFSWNVCLVDMGHGMCLDVYNRLVNMSKESLMKKNIQSHEM